MKLSIAQFIVLALVGAAAVPQKCDEQKLDLYKRMRDVSCSSKIKNSCVSQYRNCLKERGFDSQILFDACETSKDSTFNILCNNPNSQAATDILCCLTIQPGALGDETLIDIFKECSRLVPQDPCNNF